MKRFISVYFPYWPIARLHRDEPAAVPANQPFALIGSGNGARVITAVNRPAAKAGIAPGQDLAEVQLLAPSLLTRDAEPQKDRASLLALATWAGRYGARTNIDGEDGLWIEWQTAGKDSGQEALVLDDLQRRLEAMGLKAHIAIADTYGAAHALARSVSPHKPEPVQALRGGSENALMRLPVDALRLSPTAVAMLKRLGFKRIGQLYDIARAALAEQIPSRDVAEAVLLRLDQALGFAEEPLRALSDAYSSNFNPKLREAHLRPAQRDHFLSVIGTVLATPSAPMKTAKARIGTEPVFLPL